MVGIGKEYWNNKLNWTFYFCLLFEPAVYKIKTRQNFFLKVFEYPWMVALGESGSGTGCSLNIVFCLKILWFFWTLPGLLQRWCSTCLVCVHTTDTEEKQTKGRVRNIFKNSEKNTIFNEHPVLSSPLLSNYTIKL